ncbi:MAG: alpha/beta hydrolase [Polyangiaceae bacterium]|nr:alpha/beta hydrolase [Polyangiaceae bacterium]
MILSVEHQRRIALTILGAPPAVIRALAGRERRSPEGFLLDPQIQILLRASDLLGVTRWEDHSLRAARKLMNESALVLGARPDAALSIRDIRVPAGGGEIGARVYAPAARGVGPLPIVVFYHGGGFVLGSLDSHDGECRALAAGAGVIVVAVDYRLAPEHRFPAATDDAVGAFRWIARSAASLGGDPARMAVAGDSAGGNLAAAVARETRGDALRPVFQLLIYPGLDMTRSLPSHRHFRDGPLLTQRSMDYFLANCFHTDRDHRDPRASPLLAGDHAGGPPAMILTAGFDPLRDEGDAYAAALAAAGVPVDHRRYEGMVHGFFSMSAGINAAKAALADVISGLRRALHR